MRQQIKFDFHFPAIGGTLIQTWRITATHVFIEHPTFDLENDPANLQDIEDYLEDIQIIEMTGGKDLGYVLFSGIYRAELRMQIIEQGKKVGRAQIAEFFKPEQI